MRYLNPTKRIVMLGGKVFEGQQGADADEDDEIDRAIKEYFDDDSVSKIKNDNLHDCTLSAGNGGA